MKLYSWPIAEVLATLLALGPVLGAEPNSPAIHPAQPMPADETPGARPYEMVRADRQPPHVPLVNFDSLEGWQVECTEGAVADLFGSQKAARVGIARRTARLSRHVE